MFIYYIFGIFIRYLVKVYQVPSYGQTNINFAMGGDIDMPSIKCNVTECAYNSNVMCDAPMIQVNHSGSEESSTSEETQCDTFKPKH